jgi:hypothetical protein
MVISLVGTGVFLQELQQSMKQPVNKKKNKVVAVFKRAVNFVKNIICQLFEKQNHFLFLGA